MSSSSVKRATLNPDAPVYVPGSLVSSSTGLHGIMPNKYRTGIPTAKVPSYTKRLNTGVRDSKPGLLPTPSIPPLRAGIVAPSGYGTSVGGTMYYNRVSDSSSLEDAYATPYANKPRHTTENLIKPLTETEPPPGFESFPAAFEPTRDSTDLSTDLVDSLLSLLVEQLATPSGKLCESEDSASTAVSSLAGTGGTTTPLTGLDLCGDLVRIPVDRIDTTDSEENLLEAIAGYYLPSDMN
jgi:hypothetical protein